MVQGASVVDINNDGLDDDFMYAPRWPPILSKKNMLYINQGADKTGIPVFKNGRSIWSRWQLTYTDGRFFWLWQRWRPGCVYLLVNDLIDGVYPNEFARFVPMAAGPIPINYSGTTGMIPLHHAVFTNVSAKAGILTEGYGWGSVLPISIKTAGKIFILPTIIKTIFFISITITAHSSNQCAAYFKHSSKNAIGNDVQISITTDWMISLSWIWHLPAITGKKMMMNDMSYQTYQNFDRFGYMYQYAQQHF